MTLFALSFRAWADRPPPRLSGREPERKSAAVFFNQESEEAIKRTHNGAVDDYRFFFLPFFVYIVKVKLFRHIKINLHGRDSVFFAQNIFYLDVYFRAVEGGFSGSCFVFF